MSNVRRWYVYLICAITINAVVWSVIALLRNLLIPSLDAPVEFLALQIAVIIIALPIYLVHWLWASRSTYREADERVSMPRRLYLYGMMAAFLAPLIGSGFWLLRSLFLLLFQESLRYRSSPRLDPDEQAIYFLISIIVLVLMWAYHWRAKKADDLIEPESDVSIVFRQLYTTTFCLAGLFLSTLAFVNLLRWLMFQLVPSALQLETGELLLSFELARILVGLPLWLVFWRQAQEQFYGADERDKKSVVRKAYLNFVIFISVLTVVTTATFVVADLLGRIFDVPGSDGDVRLPLAIFIAVGSVLAYHAYVLRTDVEEIEEARQQALVRRIYLYLMAGVGLAALLAGLVGDLSVLIRALTGRGLILELREQITWFTAVLIAGLPLWVLYWHQIQIVVSQAGKAGMEERRSLVRRVYLYFFILIATLAAISSAIYIVSQLIELALGARASRGLGTDIGQAIAYLFVAAGVWLYHGSLLRADSRLIKEEEARQAKPLNVLVADKGDGSLGNQIIAQLSEKLPGITITPLVLSSEAAEGLDLEKKEQEQSPEKVILEAEVIIGPWTMVLGQGLAEKSIVSSTARKLLIPIFEEGWEWVGVEDLKTENIVEQVVDAVKQMSMGEEVKAGRKMGTLAIVLIVLVSLCLLSTIVSAAASFFMY